MYFSVFCGGDGILRDATNVTNTWSEAGAAAELHGGAGAAGYRNAGRTQEHLLCFLHE